MELIELSLEPELEHCRCGGMAKITEQGVECERCGFVLPVSRETSLDDAIRRWNRIWRDKCEF